MSDTNHFTGSSYSQPFSKMAEAIEHTLQRAPDFGGACVIVPPGGQLPAIEVLMVEHTEDPAQFMAVVLARIQKAIAARDQLVRDQQGFVR